MEKKLRISDVELQELLTRFNGYKVDQNLSSFKKFSLNFFVNNVVPTFHTDIRINATLMNAHYNTYYKRKGSSFLAYLYYNLIQTMQQEQFNYLRYRFINNEWYCFDDLPLFLSVTLGDQTTQQKGLFIEHVAHLSWTQFVEVYSEGIITSRKSDPEIFAPLGWYGISHEMALMPFDFSGYSPSQKHNDYNAHKPWFVASKRQIHEENNEKKVTFTLSLSWSHASTLPSEMNRFLIELQHQMEKIPEHQQLTRYFTKN